MILFSRFAKYIAFLFFYFFIDKFINNFFFLFIGLTTEWEGETLARFVEESSLKKSSLFVRIGGRAEEVMEDYLIIVNELSILEQTAVESQNSCRKIKLGVVVFHYLGVK